MTLERDVAHEKARLEPRWAELVYDGLWYSPLKMALDAFFAETQRYVSGEVRLRCEPGTAPDGVGACFVVGRRSPVGLYEHDLATYTASDRFRHQDAEGFVRISALASKPGPVSRVRADRVRADQRQALSPPARGVPGRRAEQIGVTADDALAGPFWREQTVRGASCLHRKPLFRPSPRQ